MTLHDPIRRLKYDPSLLGSKDPNSSGLYFNRRIGSCTWHSSCHNYDIKVALGLAFISFWSPIAFLVRSLFSQRTHSWAWASSGFKLSVHDRSFKLSPGPHVFLGLPYPGPISLWVLTALGYISTASDVWGYEPGVAMINEALFFCSVTAVSVCESLRQLCSCSFSCRFCC